MYMIIEKLDANHNDGQDTVFMRFTQFWFIHTKYKTRKLCYRKVDRAMRPTLWMPLKFSGLPDYAHYSQHFHGLLFRSTL